jgi:hypothetical protein
MARGNHSEEMERQFMQQLASNLEKMEGKSKDKSKFSCFDLTKNSRGAVLLFDRSEKDIDPLFSTFLGLSQVQWDRIDEIHNMLMKERQMQQKPGRE